MKKLFLKCLSFFTRDHMTKYLTQIILFAVVLAIFFWRATDDTVGNVIETVVGLLFTTMFLYIMKVVLAYSEDALKINYDTEYLLKKYPGGIHYRKRLEMNGTRVEFAYADSMVNRGYEFRVEDHPERMFRLDDFIMSNYAILFSAHSNSAKENATTIRLDGYELKDNVCTFRLSRSTYFNHLVTNRAIDFNLFEDLTLREMFEYGPTLSAYEDSKMSNHVGINGLVFLSDGRLLVPRRQKDSTISKNKITSSIAVKLNGPADGSGVVTAEHLLYGTIMDNLSARLKLRAEDVPPEEVEVRFLGFGQNIYEGGKPQFYFAAVLKNIDTHKYLHRTAAADSGSKLDVDKYIYVADYSSYRFGKDTVSFDVIDEQGRRKNIKAGYEMSYLCNLWHYEQSRGSAAGAR